MGPGEVLAWLCSPLQKATPGWGSPRASRHPQSILTRQDAQAACTKQLQKLLKKGSCGVQLLAPHQTQLPIMPAPSILQQHQYSVASPVWTALPPC